MYEQDPTPQAAQTPTRSALTFDPASYRAYLADYDWTDEQKDQFIEALWKILVSFVDCGFGLAPIQQVLPLIPTLDQDSDSMVALDQFSNSNKKEAAPAFAEAVACRTDS